MAIGRRLADVNGGQVGKGDWVFARAAGGRVERLQVVSVFDGDDGLRRVLLSDDAPRFPREAYTDELQAVIEVLAQARNDAAWKARRAEEAARVVDALVTQARACGLDLDGHPEVYPLGQGQQNGRA